ncbi:MAG: TadE/TadG family type IV pilus assembly protein [Phycisphaerae bacterium]
MKKPCLHKSCPGPLAGDTALDRAGAAIRGAGGGALRTLGAFARDTSGAIAIMVVLLVPVLFGFLGIAVDVGLWYAQKRALQTAADAAAISGAVELANNNTDAGAETAAVNDATRNGFDPADGSLITVNIPPATGPNAGNAGSVEVIITRPMQLLFSQVFHFIRGEQFATTAQVRAVANTVVQDEFCMVALDPTAQRAIDVSGQAEVELDNCGLGVNSNADNAVNVVGNGSIEADSLGVVGDINIQGGGDIETDTLPQTNTRPIVDALADLDIPTPPPCASGTINGLPFDTNVTPLVLDGSFGGTVTLPPGNYCGGLTVTGNNTDVELVGGGAEYFITDGDLKLRQRGRIDGEQDGGNVIFLTENPGGSVGSLSIRQGSELETEAPTSGDYEGISIFQDRNAPSGGNNRNEVHKSGSGGPSSELEVDGILYFPSQELLIFGDAEIEVDPNSDSCPRVIALRISLQGKAEIEIDCDSGSVNTAAFGRRVARLGE